MRQLQILNNKKFDILIPANPFLKGGQLIPEGVDVIMFREDTQEAWVDFRYSSLPQPYQCEFGWVTHWCKL